MTWQLASFTILGAGLVAGFAWYERTKPDSRLVALVGTLAAFGALGRIAFAAIPNVKPTTDIVLISGYVLGGAPGFVVGAVSALSSNFFFGQGPWTPWQMTGWGVTGLLGAALAVLTRRKIARWPLALVSFVIGFAFTAFQDFGDWVTYSNHSLAALGVYVGKGIGFDLIHASGCLIFALAFGPAFRNTLQRFRRRLSVTWTPPDEPDPPPSVPRRIPTAAAALLAAVLLCVTVAGTVRPDSARAAAAGSGPRAYLLGAEHANGGFGLAPNQSASTLASGWAVIALGAERAATGTSALDGAQTRALAYLRRTIRQESDPGSIERTVLAMRALGSPVKDVNGVPLLSRLKALIGRNGSVDGQTNLTSFAILALHAAGAKVPASTVSWLAAQQDGDGGFNFDTGGAHTASDVDDTGAAMQALAGTGNRAVIAAAIAYLRKQQNRDGGFPSEPGGTSNSQSTAFAVQGLQSAGVPVATVRRSGGKSPVQYLDGLIGRSGAVAYSRGSHQTPVWVTGEVLPALVGEPLPIKFRPAAAGATVSLAVPRTAGRLLASLQSLL